MSHLSNQTRPAVCIQPNRHGANHARTKRFWAASPGSLACLLGSAAVPALLSACASKPQISARQESTQYLSRASRTYTPPGPASDPWGPYIVDASAKFDVPERWIREVMRQETGGRLYGRNGDLITSSAGAMGLMQVMPGTYDELRARYPELGSDPFDPRNNILAGTAYIREMYDIYGSPGFLAAYNAGPGRLDDYLTRNRTLPEETRRYVANVGPKIAGSSPATRSPGEQYAMNALPFQIPEGPRYTASQTTLAPIVLNPTPYIARLEPVPQRAAVQVAQLPEPAAASQGTPIVLASQPIVLSPQPIEVAQAPEPPRLEPYRPDWLRVEPPRPEPFRPQAVMPEPPRAPQRLQGSGAARQFAALTPVPPLQPARFSLVSPANAAPVATHRGGFAPGNWAVQVGAFENSNLAAAATAAARETARDALGTARPAVTTVRQPRGTLYRARLVGLSRDAAAQACERLARSRTNCIIVSPDAQS